MAVSIFKPGRFIGPEQVQTALRFIQSRAKCKVAVIGGVALQGLGSPRLTSGVDVAAPATDSGLDLTPYVRSSLSYGGGLWKKEGSPAIKAVVRRDEYAGLYQGAIDCARTGPEGVPVASPEHLAAMKFVIQDLTHTLDLRWLLGQPGLVDRGKLKEILYKHVGGRFAWDALQILDEDVQLDIEEEVDRSKASYP